MLRNYQKSLWGHLVVGLENERASSQGRLRLLTTDSGGKHPEARRTSAEEFRWSTDCVLPGLNAYKKKLYTLSPTVWQFRAFVENRNMIHTEFPSCKTWFCVPQ